jgi:hypothetical protein
VGSNPTLSAPTTGVPNGASVVLVFGVLTFGGHSAEAVTQGPGHADFAVRHAVEIDAPNISSN